MLATIFFPLIAFIAALLLQGNQPDPRKKAQLRAWAWLSGVWTLVGFLFVLLAVGSFAGHASGRNVSRSGPCNGGPDMNATGRNTPGTDKYVLPCVFGGTDTTRLPTP